MGSQPDAMRKIYQFLKVEELGAKLGRSSRSICFIGTGNFTVPIALPLGRKGFLPQLSLLYTTGNGNGPFGLE
jgi:hypothetical protein